MPALGMRRFLQHSRRCCAKRFVIIDVEDAKSSSALACTVVPSGFMTHTWQVMRSTWLWHCWSFATCECRVDGFNVAAGGERDLNGLRLFAVDGASLSLSKGNNVLCAVWPTWHLCNNRHCSLWCPDFRQLKQSWLVFSATLHWSCDRDLNFLHAYNGLFFPPHTAQELTALALPYSTYFMGQIFTNSCFFNLVEINSRMRAAQCLIEGNF